MNEFVYSIYSSVSTDPGEKKSVSISKGDEYDERQDAHGGESSARGQGRSLFDVSRNLAVLRPTMNNIT